MNRNNKSWINRNNLTFIALIGFIVFLSNYKYFTNQPHLDSNGLPSPMVPYEAKKIPFRIEHPESWHVTELTQGNHGDKEVIGIVAPMGKYYPSVTIAYREMDEYQTMDNIVKWGESRINQCIEFNPGEIIVESSSDQIGVIFNYNCFTDVSTNFLFSQNRWVQCTDYYVLKEVSAYDLSFCAPTDDWAKVEQIFSDMRNSFRIN